MSEPRKLSLFDGIPQALPATRSSSFMIIRVTATSSSRRDSERETACDGESTSGFDSNPGTVSGVRRISHGSLAEDKALAKVGSCTERDALATYNRRSRPDIKKPRNHQSKVGGTPEEPIVQMVQSSVGSVSGDGLMPDTEASIWLFSDPTLVGSVTVAEDGSFEAEFLVDETFIATGEHTLQIQGVGEDGYIKAINLGVLIEESVETTSESASSMLWWIIAAGVLVVALIVVGSLVVRRKRLV